MEKKTIIIFAFLLCIIDVQSSTQYIDRGLSGGIVPHQLRDKVISSKISEDTSYSNWVERGSLSNKGSKTSQTFTYSYSETNSRTFTIGSGITKSVLSAEVSLSIGGSLSWSKTDTLSGSKNVPANKVAHAYVRNQIKTTKFKHIIQRQCTDIAGKWKDSGSQKVSTSTVKSITPQIKIDIKDN